MRDGVTRTFQPCEHDEAPGFLANLVARLFARTVDRKLGPAGLSVAQLAPLLILAEQGPLLQRDLVRQSPNGQPAMVATLSRLERAGLVARRPHEDDGRASLVELTVAGREAERSGRSALTFGNEKAFADFSPDERAMAIALLRRMAANLDQAS